MKKYRAYFVLSLIFSILGLIFTIAAVFLHDLSSTGTGVLLVFSLALFVIGIIACAVNHKKYTLSESLLSNHRTIIAKWEYKPQSSKYLLQFIDEFKQNAITTSLFVMAGCIIFSILFAYSGGQHVLIAGYAFAVLCIIIFFIARYYITAYYNDLKNTSNVALFSDDSIYFLDEVYAIDNPYYDLISIDIYMNYITAYYNDLKNTSNVALFSDDSIYFLDEVYAIDNPYYDLISIDIYMKDEILLVFEYGNTSNVALFSDDSIYFLDEVYAIDNPYYDLISIDIYMKDEILLVFEYGIPDIDEPSGYTISIPVPDNKLKTATYLKHYYKDYIVH